MMQSEVPWCSHQMSPYPCYSSFSDLTSLLPDDVLNFDDVCKWLNDGESEEKGGDSWSPAFSGVSNEPTSEMDRLHHLLAAYGEAVENGHKDLAQVIIRSIKGKINPLGESLERVVSNLFRDEEGYLKQESSKNHEAAFRAFYQIFPLGKFAHFSANSAILEALPYNIETLHVVDFDIGEGIQWPPLIEAMSQRRMALRFTSIKKTSDEYSRFEETKTRLVDYAKPFGLRLQIEEMTIEEMASQRGHEFLVFNCMYRLPHMGKRRCRIQALEFLKIAKDLLANKYGLVIFGDGAAMENSGSNTFSGFFNKKLIYYRLIFELLELYFPAFLGEARLAVESLFVAPQVCSFSWFKIWEENRYSGGEIGMQGMRISKENILQAKELVNVRETPLKIRAEEHEMMLEWKDTVLVKVSTWM